MIDEETFASYVAEALRHLDDRPSLAGSPLARLLSRSGASLSGDQLCSIIRKTIDDLSPGAVCSNSSPRSRRHRHLALRYLEGATLEQIAHQLGISPRQAHRDHAEARDELTTALYGLYSRLVEDREQASGQAGQGSPGSRAAVEVTLTDELVRVGALLPESAVDVNEIVRGVVTTVSQLTAAPDPAVEIALPAKLPVVYANRTVLRQILLNVFVYLLRVGRSAPVRVEAVPGPEEVVVKLGRESLEGTGANRPSYGDDRGIDAAGRLADLQGIVLSVVDEPDGGRRVELHLPTSKLTTVLLVDDNPDLSRLFRGYLRHHNYRLVQATNGVRALELARELSPAIVILDVLLPAQDGWEILQALRECPQTRQARFIICSVLAEQELVSSLGIGECLPKPVRDLDLLAALDRCRSHLPQP